MMDTILTDSDELSELKQCRDAFFSCIPGIENASAVPVLQAADLRKDIFSKEWVANNKPCLVKGAVKDWPAVQKWRDKDYWMTACDNFDVMVYPHQNYNDQKRQKGELMRFYDAIDRLFQKKDRILSIPSERIIEGQRFYKVINDLEEFPFFTPELRPRMYDHRRFFTYRKAGTAWHYHNIDETLMCQINGAKTVALLSPGIPDAKHVTDFLTKELYLDGRSLDRSLDLKPFIVDVEEGDALYIPPYWHHVVIPKDAEIGFTLAYCWRSPWHKFGDFSNFFVRELYKRALWPIKPITPVVPFLAFYSWVKYHSRKIARKS
jgi:cupin-like protein